MFIRIIGAERVRSYGDFFSRLFRMFAGSSLGRAADTFLVRYHFIHIPFFFSNWKNPPVHSYRYYVNLTAWGVKWPFLWFTFPIWEILNFYRWLFISITGGLPTFGDILFKWFGPAVMSAYWRLSISYISSRWVPYFAYLDLFFRYQYYLRYFYNPIRSFARVHYTSQLEEFVDVVAPFYIRLGFKLYCSLLFSLLIRVRMSIAYAIRAFQIRALLLGIQASAFFFRSFGILRNSHGSGGVGFFALARLMKQRLVLAVDMAISALAGIIIRAYGTLYLALSNLLYVRARRLYLGIVSIRLFYPLSYPLVSTSPLFLGSLGFVVLRVGLFIFGLAAFFFIFFCWLGANAPVAVARDASGVLTLYFFNPVSEEYNFVQDVALRDRFRFALLSNLVVAYVSYPYLPPVVYFGLFVTILGLPILISFISIRQLFEFFFATGGHAFSKSNYLRLFKKFSDISDLPFKASNLNSSPELLRDRELEFGNDILDLSLYGSNNMLRSSNPRGDQDYLMGLSEESTNIGVFLENCNGRLDSCNFLVHYLFSVQPLHQGAMGAESNKFPVSPFVEDDEDYENYAPITGAPYYSEFGESIYWVDNPNQYGEEGNLLVFGEEEEDFDYGEETVESEMHLMFSDFSSGFEEEEEEGEEDPFLSISQGDFYYESPYESDYLSIPFQSLKFQELKPQHPSFPYVMVGSFSYDEVLEGDRSSVDEFGYQALGVFTNNPTQDNTEEYRHFLDRYEYELDYPQYGWFMADSDAAIHDGVYDYEQSESDSDEAVEVAEGVNTISAWFSTSREELSFAEYDLLNSDWISREMLRESLGLDSGGKLVYQSKSLSYHYDSLLDPDSFSSYDRAELDYTSYFFKHLFGYGFGDELFTSVEDDKISELLLSSGSLSRAVKDLYQRSLDSYFIDIVLGDAGPHRSVDLFGSSSTGDFSVDSLNAKASRLSKLCSIDVFEQFLQLLIAVLIGISLIYRHKYITRKRSVIWTFAHFNAYFPFGRRHRKTSRTRNFWSPLSPPVLALLALLAFYSSHSLIFYLGDFLFQSSYVSRLGRQAMYHRTVSLDFVPTRVAQFFRGEKFSKVKLIARCHVLDDYSLGRFRLYGFPVLGGDSSSSYFFEGTGFFTRLAALEDARLSLGIFNATPRTSDGEYYYNDFVPVGSLDDENPLINDLHLTRSLQPYFDEPFDDIDDIECGHPISIAQFDNVLPRAEGGEEEVIMEDRYEQLVIPLRSDLFSFYGLGFKSLKLEYPFLFLFSEGWQERLFFTKVSAMDRAAYVAWSRSQVYNSMGMGFVIPESWERHMAMRYADHDFYMTYVNVFYLTDMEYSHELEEAFLHEPLRVSLYYLSQKFDSRTRQRRRAEVAKAIAAAELCVLEQLALASIRRSAIS